MPLPRLLPMLLVPCTLAACILTACDVRPPPVPPPPPPPPTVVATVPHELAPTVPAGCAVIKCEGHVSPELITALTFTTRAVHSCYDSALVTQPNLQGSVMLTARIGADGQLCGVKVKKTDLADPKVADCMADTFTKRLEPFPRPEDGCLEVDIPIALLPPKAP